MCNHIEDLFQLFKTVKVGIENKCRTLKNSNLNSHCGKKTNMWLLIITETPLSNPTSQLDFEFPVSHT
jgi:hypothetical protein